MVVTSSLEAAFITGHIIAKISLAEQFTLYEQFKCIINSCTRYSGFLILHYNVKIIGAEMAVVIQCRIGPIAPAAGGWAGARLCGPGIQLRTLSMSQVFIG